MNIGNAIEQLFSQHHLIRNRDVRELTGLSRQAVCAALNKLVDNGQLVRAGRGRSLHYLPIQADPRRDLDHDPSRGFWAGLLECMPKLHYARVVVTCPRRDRRIDAEAAWRLFDDKSHVILDFDGVDDATPHFLSHLLFEGPTMHLNRVMPINLSPTLKPKLDEAARMHARAEDTFVG